MIGVKSIRCTLITIFSGIFGGYLLGIYSSSGLSFYDWDTLKLVRRIDIQPTHVYWAENASLVALATADQYFILKYQADTVQAAAENAEDIEEAFEVQTLLYATETNKSSHKTHLKFFYFLDDCRNERNCKNRTLGW